MTSFGPVHTLIVRDVGEPYGPLDTHEFECYEIVHSVECPQRYNEHYRCWEYTCVVGEYERECGVRWSLKYVGTPVNQRGAYRIQAWAEKYVSFEFTEYDGGIAVVIDE